jgi:hypothetical protein
MPTADACLLPPPLPPEERGSVRRLDEVGVEAVLGAMIEQKRRASQPSFSAIDTGIDTAIEQPEEEAPPGGRAPTKSEVFLKAR